MFQSDCKGTAFLNMPFELIVQRFELLLQNGRKALQNLLVVNVFAK